MKKLKLKKGADVWILGREEENAEGMMLPEILKKSMKNLRYCKMERTGENYVGTIKMPRQEKAGGIAFAFYLEEPHSDEDGGQLMIEEESGRLAVMVEENREDLEGSEDGHAFMLNLLHLLMQDDVLQLERLEESMYALEEELLKGIPENFQERTARCRRKLFTLHTYYEQMVNLAQNMEDAPHLARQDETCAEWGRLADKAERLHNHVEMLREYLIQIRELYQSRTAEQQNRIMTMLTVITTIFLPLTLIAGWYGMNFPNMPELHWRYGYAVVIGLSVLIVTLEILYFKKKKML
ncbi:MAG: CorA family divalent cation transporter [Anaerovoracaceae bacterium]|nr:CorA family divalent cation transporter [Anaerovoracaceae bacterium]